MKVEVCNQRSVDLSPSVRALISFSGYSAVMTVPKDLKI